MPASTDDDFSLTISTVARQVERSEATVRLWADRGYLAVIRASSGARLFRQKDVTRLAERLKGGSTGTETEVRPLDKQRDTAVPTPDAAA